jgi:hypothetical protein
MGDRTLSPLSAMVATWHHIVVSFYTESVHWNFDIPANQIPYNKPGIISVEE